MPNSYANTTRDHPGQLGYGGDAWPCLGRDVPVHRTGADRDHAVLAGRGAHRVCLSADLCGLAVARRQGVSDRRHGLGRADRRRGSQFRHPLHASELGAAIGDVGICRGVHGLGRADHAAACAYLRTGERITSRRLIGLGIGFAGVVILLGGQVFASTGNPLEPYGRMACFGAAACYAGSSVLMRRLPPIDPFGLGALALAFGSLLVIPTALVVEGPPPLPDGRTLVLIAALGLIPTAGANMLRILVIRSAGPVFMTLVNYQVPMWSVILGIVILGETFKPVLLLAMGLILGGLMISQWGALNRLFRRGAQA